MEYERTPIPPALRMMVLSRDNFTCQYCGRRAPFVELHIDHVKPVSRGGNDMPSNLVTACQECNLGKNDTFYVPPKIYLFDVVWRFLTKRIVLVDDADYRMFRAYQAGQIQPLYDPKEEFFVENLYDEDAEESDVARILRRIEAEGKNQDSEAQ